MDSKRKAKKVDRKKELCFEVAAVVRKIQKQYISTKSKSGLNGDEGESAGAPEGEQLAANVEGLCVTIEAVFLHELKNSKGVMWKELQRPNPAIPPEPSFWLFIEPVVSDEIKMQLLALRDSESDIRKCRSWIRLMLAKNLMISFLEDLQRHPGLLAFHYGGGALLRDAEQSEIIIQLLKGLSVLQLHYDHASNQLNTWDQRALTLSGMWEGPPEGGGGSGASSPRSIQSPARSSPSVQRVSPPTSDFDFEGIAIIDLAMDKYSRRRASSSKMSDSQLISREIADSHAHTRQRGVSSTSVESGSSLTQEGEAGLSSYGAMLRSYTQGAESEAQVGGGARRGGRAGGEAVGGVAGRGQERAWQEGREEEEEDEEVNSEGFAIALSLNYEIISSDGSFVDSQQYEPLQHKTVMAEHLVKLVNEKGLDSQNYKCCSCSRDIGIIFGQAKLCKFNGQHYCYDCHRDDERIIPARVLFNWDFRTHKVCLASCEFLDSIELSPILDVEKVNKALYMYIPALEESLKLRQQCRYLKDYLMTCKEQDVLDQFRKKLHSSHIYEDVHKYSMKDLIEVNSGTFNERLRKLVKFATKHVKQCPLCSQKGFICEVCHDPRVIYPFDLMDTSQCETCKAVYHKVCRPEKGVRNCPKCMRLRKRTDSLSN